MSGSPEPIIGELREFRVQLQRVCPRAASGLAVSGSPPPLISVRDRINILRALPDNAGTDDFLSAWRAFARANPGAVLNHAESSDS